MFKCWSLLIIASFISSSSLIEASAPGQCDCSIGDSCEYLDLKCQNGGTFRQQYCGPIVCPTQMPGAKLPGFGWRPTLPLNNLDPRVGCADKNETAYQCANGMYVGTMKAEAEYFGFTPDTIVDWSESCDCPEGFIGTECAQVKSPAVNNLRNCPSGQIFDGNLLNPLVDETTAECFFEYPFEVDIFGQTSVELKRHRLSTAVRFAVNDQGRRAIEGIDFEFKMRVVPDAADDDPNILDLCTNTMAIKCQTNACTTTEVEGGGLQVICKEPSCDDFIPCEGCMQYDDCTDFECVYFAIKILYNSFNSPVAAGDFDITFNDIDFETGEFRANLALLGGLFKPGLVCRTGKCVNRPEGCSDEAKTLCETDCFDKSSCEYAVLSPNITETQSNRNEIIGSIVSWNIGFVIVIAIALVWVSIRSVDRRTFTQNGTSKLELPSNRTSSAQIGDETSIKANNSAPPDDTKLLVDRVEFEPIFDELPHERRIGLGCKEIGYSIPTSKRLWCPTFFCHNNKRILNSCSVVAHSGEMVAVIGPSGSGKSTLLDILFGRPKKGSIAGSVFPICSTKDGSVLYPNSRKSFVSYIRQDDQLLPSETVFEAVWFSAKMRLPSNYGENEIKERVMRTLKSLRIDHIANSQVGSSDTGGISGGERRRLATAVELVTEPSVIIADEPTSGLDSFSTGVLIDVLKSAAGQGCTVICSIHQPPPDVFKAFDRTVMVSRVGSITYFGATESLIPYLSALPEYRRFFGEDTTVHAERNPAEIALEFLSRLTAGDAYRVDRYWIASEENSRIKSEIEQCENTNKQPKITITRSKPLFAYKFVYLCERGFRTITRQPSLMLMQFVVTVTVGLLITASAGSVIRDLQGSQTIAYLMLFFILFFAMLSMSSIGTIVTDISVFIRESQAQMYSALPYVLSKVVCDVLPLRVLPAVVFACISYWSMGLYSDVSIFSDYVGTLILVNIIATSICFLVSSIAVTVGLANLVVAAITMWCFIFSGALVITEEGIRLRASSYFFYAWEIMVTNEFKQGTYLFNPKGVGLDPGFVRDGTDVTKQLELDAENIPSNFVYLVVWAIVGMMGTFLVLSIRKFPS